MPPGRFAQLIFHLKREYGGLTGSMLQRARAFHAHAGVEAPILTLDFNPEYDALRAELRRRGDLPDTVSMINLYEHFRDTELVEAPLTGHDLAQAQPPRALWRESERDSQGRLVRTSYRWWRRPSVKSYDYYRRDGSTFMTEIPAPDASDPGRVRVLLRDRQSRVVAALPSQQALWSRFLADIAADENLFLAIDSKASLTWLMERRNPQLFTFPVVHNLHLRKPRHHHSELAPSRAAIFRAVDRFDGLIILTPWQAQDVTDRVGRRNNIFVISHAVRELPTLPPYQARDAQTCVMLARLERVKRIDHGIRAFALVTRSLPQARLEIYGQGQQRDALARLIDELGMRDNVRLMGFDPQARARLTRATVSMLSSVNEGQPLAVLESFAAGCPVVSYDFKYGPRDMITSGEDGFLVPDGDIAALSAAITGVLSDPDLAERMSRAARRRAEHDFMERELVRHWAHVFSTALAQRPRFTRLLRMTATAERYGWSAPGVFAVAGAMDAHAEVPDAAADDALVSLRVYDEDRLDFVEVACEFSRIAATGFRFSAQLDLAAICADVSVQSGERPQRLRVLGCLTWNNSFREAPVKLAAPPGLPTSPEGAGTYVLEGSELRFRLREPSG